MKRHISKLVLSLITLEGLILLRRFTTIIGTGKFDSDHVVYLMLVLWIPLVFLHYKREGISVSSIPHLLTILTLLGGALFTGVLQVVFTVIALICFISFIAVVILFPVYQYMDLPGPYKVGYFTHVQKEFTMGVYYPTNDKTSNNPGWMPDERAFDSYYSVAQSRPGYPPKWLVRMTVDFTSKHKIPASYHVPLASYPDVGGYRVIILSHGLGGNRRTYSLSSCYFASLGYIVFSLEHFDDGAKIFRGAAGAGAQQLQVRVNHGMALLNELFNPRFLPSVFREALAKRNLGSDIREIPLNLKNITVMGHSFGGITALCLAQQDPRIQYCVMLDPWLNVAGPSIYNTKFKANTILFESATFEIWASTQRVVENNKNLIEAQAHDPNRIVAFFRLHESDHISWSDSVFLIGKQVELAKMLRDLSLAENIFSYTLESVRRFITSTNSQEFAEFKGYMQNDIKKDVGDVGDVSMKFVL